MWLKPVRTKLNRRKMDLLKAPHQRWEVVDKYETGPSLETFKIVRERRQRLRQRQAQMAGRNWLFQQDRTNRSTLFQMHLLGRRERTKHASDSENSSRMINQTTLHEDKISQHWSLPKFRNEWNSTQSKRPKRSWTQSQPLLRLRLWREQRRPTSRSKSCRLNLSGQHRLRPGRRLRRKKQKWLL